MQVWVVSTSVTGKEEKKGSFSPDSPTTTATDGLHEETSEEESYKPQPTGFKKIIYSFSGRISSMGQKWNRYHQIIHSHLETVADSHHIIQRE
ncbi:hypothetical protein NXX53_23525 [Bacteroides salyersiae]|nr:hypothetical protein [Bacteroides salyersiae]